MRDPERNRFDFLKMVDTDRLRRMQAERNSKIAAGIWTGPGTMRLRNATAAELERRAELSPSELEAEERIWRPPFIPTNAAPEPPAAARWNGLLRLFIRHERSPGGKSVE
jgi:hypothetical protein